ILKTEPLLTNYSISEEEEVDNLLSGVVIRKGRGQYLVQTESGSRQCVISALLRKKLVYPTADPNSLEHYNVQRVDRIEMVGPLAVGDVVRFLDAGDGTGMIKAVEQRKSSLSRRDPGPIPLEQVLVANADQMVAVFLAARPKPSWRLLDRYLVLAEMAHLPAIICVTKMDLVKPQDQCQSIDVYRSLGHQVIFTSTVSGQGIERLRDALQGRLSIFAGKSGVGKTSLLNALQPDLGLRVKAVSHGKVGKGRHTTTLLEMFPLDGGGWVVDTPGMRELGFWDMDAQDIAASFRELRPYLGKCKFGASCRHRTEPGCAVKQAVDNGAVHQQRYESYLVLAEEVG
ncbi:MAG: ribosome small subunit-dependent GTPase A, partial [Anaerolineae bacterium]|nr:ribosome small subunit-dependent GTPase A [Anaerolineae bacterium]